MAASDAPVYIIIGATGGIGSHVTRLLANDGAQLILGARTESDLESLAKEVDGEAFPLDATNYEDVQQIVDHATETYGQLNGVGNFVGSILLKPAHLTSVEEYRTTVAKNLDTSFFTVKAAARAMMKDGGSIVLSSSAVARTGLKNHEAIAAAKAGIIGLTKSAAATYARRGVRVNALAPGLVETGMSKHILSSDAGRKQSEQMHALGRIGTPEDIAPAAHWLLSDTSSWVTGQVIGVDGGLSTVRGQ